MPHQVATADAGRLLPMGAAAIYLGITRRSLERLMARGLVRPVRLPGLRRTLVDREDLNALVAKAKVAPR